MWSKLGLEIVFLTWNYFDFTLYLYTVYSADTDHMAVKLSWQ